MTAVRARVCVRGRVQGVWYPRVDAARGGGGAASSGWVRNRVDGDVEAEIEGARDQVEALIAWAHHGPRNAERDRRHRHLDRRRAVMAAGSRSSDRNAR